MELLTATLFLTLCPELWAGSSVMIGNKDFDIESKVQSRIELFAPQVIGFKPDQIKYDLKLGWNIDERYRVEIAEECKHGIDSPIRDKNVVNQHSVKFIRKNLKGG